MIRIDTYHALSQPMIDSREPALTIANCKTGVERWVDEIDGFGDQYFESAKPGRKLTFVIIPDASIPPNLTEFEAIPVVSASLVKVHGTKALITINDVQPLGQWARECFLAGGLTIRSLSQWLRPGDEWLERLRRVKLVVRPSNEPWRPHVRLPWAAYLCTDETKVERYLAIYSNHAGCYLARVPPSE